MKATLEKIEPGFGSSFKVEKHTEKGYCCHPNWHFHPEYEIVYISNGRGKRHIGNHISYFEDGDLIFLGPNLPHFGFTEELFEEHFQIVVQMKEEFLGKDFFAQPELQSINQLFARAKQGISFSGNTKQRVGNRLNDLLAQNNFIRLIELLQILQELAISEEYQLLNASGITVEVNAQDQARLQKIFHFVGNNFSRQIPLEEVAALINMTVPAFCRFFKRLSQRTFTRFVNEVRVAHACRLLANNDLSISGISYESGFNNISHFNKQFKLLTGQNPRDYRKKILRAIHSI